MNNNERAWLKVWEYMQLSPITKRKLSKAARLLSERAKVKELFQKLKQSR